MFRLFECCALSFFERFVLSFSLKIERFVSDSAEIWICGLYLGIILGTVVATGKVEMVSGEKIYKYKSDHRRLGWGAAILSIISMVVWKFVILV